MSEGNTGLKCNDVSYAWQAGSDSENEVLRHITFEMHSGEIVSILGPTGAGKSTLLRVLMGLTKPSAGSVTLDGAQIDRPIRSMGIVFQDHGLFPWLNVQDNIQFGLKIRGLPAVDRERLSREAMASVGLKDDGHLYPHQLSGGMKRRVAVARLLANDAEYLLMDEPFESLDYETRLRMQSFLISIHNRYAKSILLVTHQVDEAILLSDRILLMSARPGSILQTLAVGLARPRDSRSREWSARSSVPLDELV